MAVHHVLARFFIVVSCMVLTAASALAGDDWKPIDPADLALKAPVVEKDADAEVLSWEVRINDAGDDLIFLHYIRIKVFTERGKESQSKIDITYRGRNRIIDIAGRTIKSDGTITIITRSPSSRVRRVSNTEV